MPIATPRRSRRLPSARHAWCAALLALTTPWAPAADWVWSSGPFLPGTTAPQPMPASDTLFVLPGGDKFFDGVAFESFGAVSMGDPLTLQDGATVVNHGLWDAIGDFGLTDGGGAASSFVNHGTLRKSAGGGISQIAGGVGFVNHGTVASFSGTVVVGAGSSFEDGSRFSGSGIVRSLTGNSFRGTLHSENLRLNLGDLPGATHHGIGATIRGQVSWEGGAMSGTWAVDTGQALVVPSSTGATKRLVGASTELVVEGRLAWNAPAALSLEQGARLVNAGLLELDYTVAGNVSFGGDGSAGHSLVNAATGTLRMVPATRTLTVAAGAGFVSAGGTLDTQGTMLFSGGSRFEHGTRFSGSGQVVADGHNVFAGAFDSANLALRGGTHDGEGALARGTVVWTGGDLTGT
ncbi:MAG: hypothetical protein KF683_24405, partial [Rubrivivax sp.]|nr:hypothetical protein [Rubrivivax sp.]